MKNGIAAINGKNVPEGDVSPFISFLHFIEGGPGPHIRPGEVTGNDGHPVRFFHDAVVDGNGVDLFEPFLQPFCIRRMCGNNLEEPGKMRFHLFQESIRPPYEHPAVPVVTALPQKSLSLLPVGFFGKPAHGVYPRAHFPPHLYVTVPRLRFPGEDAEGYQIPLSRRGDSPFDRLPEEILMLYYVVGGQNHHDALPVLLMDKPGSEGDSGSRIFRLRLDDEGEILAK